MLTKSGKLEDVKEILPANATAITSEDELVGTWKLTGANMLGISIYGSVEDMSQFLGDSMSADMVLEAGGKGTFADGEVTWEITDDGAIVGEDGVGLSIKALDDGVIMDIGELMGIDMVLYFTK